MRAREQLGSRLDTKEENSTSHEASDRVFVLLQLQFCARELVKEIKS